MNKDIGMNMGSIKQENRAFILQVMKKHRGVSRKDIAEIVKLTPAAVTILVNEMIEEKIVLETGYLGEDDKKAGRRKIPMDINYNYKYVVGINIESELVSIAVVNLDGEVIAETDWDCAGIEISPTEFLKIVSHKCVNLFWQKSISKHSVLGVGVGIVGPVDKTSGISKHAYSLWKEHVAVKDILESTLGLPVVVDNNVRALAVAEMDYKVQHDVNDMLFVKYGPGIGSAMIIGKKLYYGAHSRAGEIGHTIGDLNGELCRCGKRGCLETVASYGSIIKEAKAKFSLENTPLLFSKCHGDSENVTLEKIIEVAYNGDMEVKKIIKNALIYMVLAISNAVSLYDPQRLVLYGEVFKHKEFIDELKKILDEMLWVEDLEGFVIISQLINEKRYIGGAALAIREFFFNVGGTVQLVKTF